MTQKSTCMCFIKMDFHTYLKLMKYFPVQTAEGQQSQKIWSWTVRGISKHASPDVSL